MSLIGGRGIINVGEGVIILLYISSSVVLNTVVISRVDASNSDVDALLRFNSGD